MKEVPGFISGMLTVAHMAPSTFHASGFVENPGQVCATCGGAASKFPSWRGASCPDS